MSKKPEVRRIDLQTEYGRSITFRRSGFSKSAWEHICQKFGANTVPYEKIQSITIDGEDDYGHMLFHINVES